jgi:hypothetical protein
VAIFGAADVAEGGRRVAVYTQEKYWLDQQRRYCQAQ